MFRKTTLKRKRLTVSLLIVAVGIAAAFLLVAPALGRQARTYDYIQPVVPAGVTLHQSADAVEKKVLDSLGTQSHLNSVVVVSSGQDALSGLGSGSPSAVEQAAEAGPVWVVRANGMFEPVTTPPGTPALTTPRDGYVVVDDSTGATLAYGW